MRKRIAIIAVTLGLVAAGVGTAIALDSDGGEDCIVSGPSGSLTVSGEKVKTLQEQGWTVSDETGKLVCP